jgi:nucleoside-specific outer membrane channel protein Tsx
VEGFTAQWKSLMNMKTLSAIALVTAALSSPAFAQDDNAAAPQKPAHALRHYRSSYNQVQGPAFVAPRGTAGDYFEGESFDRSRIGDHDADFTPSGS